MFAPRLAIASLSGRSDAAWAGNAEELVGAAFLGGISLDQPTRNAAREMVDRDREEFLPDDPLAFLDRELTKLDNSPLRPAFNVRATTPAPVAEAAAICRAHDAIVEVNAHCRQREMCSAGAGETLLTEPDRLCQQVSTAAAEGADVSVKVRTELTGVDLPEVARRVIRAGADAIHVDAMDSEPMVAEVVTAVDGAGGGFVIANNGVRGYTTAREYLAYGADAVSVARPSDDPRVLDRIRTAVDTWFERDRRTQA